jgi:hypothetical protein
MSSISNLGGGVYIGSTGACTTGAEPDLAALKLIFRGGLRPMGKTLGSCGGGTNSGIQVQKYLNCRVPLVVHWK